MKNIKAIETYYNGYKFRSRLEARWAVFFDALGVKYEYEPQGFDLGNGSRYLPDFKIKCWGKRGSLFDEPFDLWIEVKGVMSDSDSAKIKDFTNFEALNEIPWDDPEYDKKVEAVNTHSILVVGDIPNPDTYNSMAGDLGSYDSELMNDIYPWNYESIDNDYFACFPAVTSDGKFYLDGDDSSYKTTDLNVIRNAFRKARQARFEYGETPKTGATK